MTDILNPTAAETVRRLPSCCARGDPIRPGGLARGRDPAKNQQLT